MTELDKLKFKEFIELRYNVRFDNDEFFNKYITVYKHELEAFETACEYKQNELTVIMEVDDKNKLKIHYLDAGKQIQKLQAENKKLREALAFYENCTRLMLDVRDLPKDPVLGYSIVSSKSIMDNGDVAREALKEVEDE